MTRPTGSDPWMREELLHLLSLSGTLAGLCVTVVAVMNTLGKNSNAVTTVDDLFAVCALLFLTCSYVIFWALRTRKASVAQALVKVADTVFLVALTIMTIGAFVMVYTVW